MGPRNSLSRLKLKKKWQPGKQIKHNKDIEWANRIAQISPIYVCLDLGKKLCLSLCFVVQKFLVWKKTVIAGIRNPTTTNSQNVDDREVVTLENICEYIFNKNVSPNLTVKINRQVGSHTDGQMRADLKVSLLKQEAFKVEESM